MLDIEIEKYRRLGRTEIVDWYDGHQRGAAGLATRVAAIRESLDGPDAP